MFSVFLLWYQLWVHFNLRDIFLTLFQTVFDLVKNVDFPDIFSPTFLFGFFQSFTSFSQCSLYSIKCVVSSLLNFRGAAFLRLIAFLQSSLSHDLFLDAILLGMYSSIIDINVSVNSSVEILLFSVS